MSNNKKRAFSLEDIKKSKVFEKNKHLFDNKTKSSSLPIVNKTPKSKIEFYKIVENYAIENKIDFKKELLFNKIFKTDRRFRFDFAFPDLKVGIEYDGIFSEKSRHTTIKGFMEDCVKLNIATSAGWFCLRYHSGNYKNFREDMDLLLKNVYARFKAD